MPRTSQQTLGKYEILEEIGRGATAVVYKARDTALARTVALKVMHPSLLWNPEAVERFLREARAAAQLEHPNIVTIYDVSEGQGSYYIAMRYLPGPSAADLNTEGPMSIEQVLDIAAQVAGALDYAHEQGFIHRDVKPNNIILDLREQAVVTDFGLVKALEWASLSGSGSIMGTPGYIAPEIWNGEKATPATDIYSLGIVLWEMLAGRRLFEGDTPATIIKKHLVDPPPLLHEVRTDAPAALGEELAKALSKAPSQRHRKATTLIGALRSAKDPEEREAPRTEPDVEHPSTPLPEEPTARETSAQLPEGLAEPFLKDESATGYSRQSVMGPPPVQGGNELQKDTVFAIAQDREGNLWIGTKRGTAYSDGEAWYIVNDPDDYFVQAITRDQEGNLWFGTSCGVRRFDGDRWQTFTILDGLAGIWVNAIHQDQERNMWFGTWDGLTRFDGRNWQSFNTADGLAGSLVNAIAQDQADNMWFGTWDGLSCFDGENWQSFNTTDGLAGNLVHAIAVDCEGGVWFGTDHGVSRFDGANWRTFTTEDGLADNQVHAIAVDRDGGLWFGTNHGVSHFDGKRWSTFTAHDGLASNRVFAIMQDHKGNLWIGTDAGMSRLTPAR